MGAEWTKLPEYFRGIEPRNSALLQAGSRLTLGLTVPGLRALTHSGQSLPVGSPVLATTNGMSWAGGRASEGSGICTLFDQAPKCQFFLFFFIKKILLYVHN